MVFFLFVWVFVLFRIHSFLSLDLYLFNFLVCKSSATYVHVATGENVTQL